MRAVLYADDFEPITVFELESWAHQFLLEHGNVRLAVMPPVVLMPKHDQKPTLLCDQYIVNITAERLRRGQHETLMLFTRNEEAALLLKSAFLPGQYREVQDREAAAFAKGFMHAINELGRLG